MNKRQNAINEYKKIIDVVVEFQYEIDVEDFLNFKKNKTIFRKYDYCHKFFSDTLFEEFIKLVDNLNIDYRAFPDDGFSKYLHKCYSDLLYVKTYFEYCIGYKYSKLGTSHKHYSLDCGCKCDVGIKSAKINLIKAESYLEALDEYNLNN